MTADTVIVMEAVTLCRACGKNEARYISVDGFFMCGTCPIERGIDAIKIRDVGALLRWSRDVLAGGFMGGDSFGKLREIVGRKP